MVNLNILKSIDFKNQENLVFLLIILILIIVGFAIFLFVLFKCIEILKNIVKKIFNKDNQSPEFYKRDEDSDSLNVVVEELEKSKNERAKAEVQKAVGATMGGAKLDYTNRAKKQEGKDTIKNDKQKYSEKEQKSIADGLNKLKSSDSTGQKTLEEKMPSKIEKQDVGGQKGIKIPTPKRFSNSDAERITKETISATGTTAQNMMSAPSPGGPNSSIAATDKRLRGSSFLKNKTENSSGREALSQKAKENMGVSDSSIFKGGEVSKMKLEDVLETDTKVWQAAKAVGLNISPIERSKLVKDVFLRSTGRNLSKSDLKLGIKKLNQKMLNTENATEHAKIRKEIKFFKKIGGL